MTDASSVRSLRCPNCGAPVDFPAGQTSVHCRFCDSVIEHSAEALTADDHAHLVQTDASGVAGSGSSGGQARRFVIKMRDGQPVVIESSVQPGPLPAAMDPMAQSWQSSLNAGSAASIPTVQPAKRSSLGGCVVAVVVVLLMFGLIPVCILVTSPQAGTVVEDLLAGQVQQAIADAQTIGARILLTSSGTIVPGANDGPAEAILLTTQYPVSGGASENRMVAVSTTTRKLIWQTAPLDAKLSDTPILANASFVFIQPAQQLLAIRRSDGSLAWQATLADAVDLRNCRNCVRLLGTRLAVLSKDGTLEVFDAATGKSQWTVTAKQDSPRGLYVLGQRLAFMDRDAAARGVLRAFDPATGEETSVQPVCQPLGSDAGYADWTTPVFVAPTGSDFYLAFGSYPLCAERWDAQSLKMVWSNPLPEEFAATPDTLQLTFSSDSLYLAGDSTVLALSTDQGVTSTVLTDADYAFDVLATHGGDVILEARGQRGTTRYQIWSVDATTGQPKWKFDLGQDPPLDPGGIIDDNQPMWLAQPADAGLRVVHIKSAADNKSHALLAETLNWDTGQSSGQIVTSLGLPTIILEAPSWTIWKNDTLWMVMEDELLAFDAAQNKIVYRWP